MANKHMRFAHTTDQSNKVDVPLAVLTEIKDRLKRLETRSTKFFESQGFNTGVERPIWRGITGTSDVSRIDLPTPNVSIKDIMAVIPDNYVEEVDLYCGGELIATVYR